MSTAAITEEVPVASVPDASLAASSQPATVAARMPMPATVEAAQAAMMEADPLQQMPVAALDEELARQLPPWLPLPDDILRAEGEDVARRSDGYFSGTLHLTMAGSDTDPASDFATRLLASGFSRKGETKAFLSECSKQSCVIDSRPVAGGNHMLTVAFEGYSHDAGCACPGCGTADEN